MVSKKRLNPTPRLPNRDYPHPDPEPYLPQIITLPTNLSSRSLDRHPNQWCWPPSLDTAPALATSGRRFECSSTKMRLRLSICKRDTIVNSAPHQHHQSTSRRTNVTHQTFNKSPIECNYISIDLKCLNDDCWHRFYFSAFRIAGG